LAVGINYCELSVVNPLPKQMKLTSKLGTALASLGLCLASQAASINGLIRFTSGANGGVILQDSAGNITTNLADAAGIQSWVFPEVDAGDGSFINVPTGQAVSVSFSQPWIFAPPAPLSPLWTIVGFGNFTFNLSSTVVSQVPGFLLIEGTGTLTGTDTLTNTAYDATPATWTFSTQGVATDNRFSWNASTAAVPEPGTSALLSGILLWICFIRRRDLS
jgi:hypothetical protein